MGIWWFVRHGESTANAADWVSGHRDVPLTARGVAQAEALREPLRLLRPERVLASDLQRAWRTAEIAWAGRRPPVERIRALRERHCGDWEGKSRARLRERGHFEVLMTWEGGPPNGESQRMLSQRVLGWLTDNDDGRDTLVFAHGALIRCVIGLLDGTPPDAIGRPAVRNTEIVRRDVAPGRWRDLLELPFLVADIEQQRGDS